MTPSVSVLTRFDYISLIATLHPSWARFPSLSQVLRFFTYFQSFKERNDIIDVYIFWLAVYPLF